MKRNLILNRSGNDGSGTDAGKSAGESERGVAAQGLSRRDAMRYITGASVAGITASVLSGCGGGSGSSVGASVTGRATLVITWPARTSVVSKLVPVAANSIVVAFVSSGTVVSTQTVARPSGSTQSTVTFANLPPGQLTLTASAYASTDGSGTADATATTTVTIIASQNTATSITMASTIDHLTVTPTSPAVVIGTPTTLMMTAFDASGNVVLTSASTVSWASSASAVATVTSAGVVSGVATGTSQITVTESESGKTATVTATVTAASSHAVTPEGEIGPYFTDDSATDYNRTNIVANLDGTNAQSGVPLVLNIYVYDTENGNLAMQGCQVDIWHCNAAGVYSNESSESTLGQSWLRGYQVTDANGFVTFTTIVPGWYGGRTTHVHLRVRSKYSEASSTNDGTNTTQFFFPQATINYLATNVAPYKAEGINSTTNANDHVYTPETLGETQMTLTGDYTTGYAATVAIYLPITSE